MTLNIEIDVEYNENDFVRGMKYAKAQNEKSPLHSVIFFVAMYSFMYSG